MYNLALVPPSAILALEGEFKVDISWPVNQYRCPDEQVGIYAGAVHLGDLCATGARDLLGTRFTEPELRSGIANLIKPLRDRLAQHDLEAAPAVDVDAGAFSRRLWQKVDGE